MLTIEQKQLRTAEEITKILANTGLSMAKVGKLLTPPGEEIVKRQTVFDWKSGNSKPSTDRLLDVIFYATNPLAVEIASKILKSIWPEFALI